MVFKHNEQTFSLNETNQFACEPWWQMENSCEHASLPELQPLRPEKLDGRQEYFCNSHFDDAPVAGLSGFSPSVLGGNSNLSVEMGTVNESVLSEHSKRPLVDYDDCSLATKRPKQLEPNVQIVSPVLADNSPGSPSEEEDTHVDPDFITNSFPFYFDGHLRAGSLDSLREAYSTCLDYYPRRSVTLGPNNQAVIPEWRFNYLKNYPGKAVDPTSALTATTSSLHAIVEATEDDCAKMSGTCIMPMPADALVLHADSFQQKLDCGCPDVRSVRCVRQHITEVREKLEKALGHDSFVDLGFCDMGEIAAEKWSEEEEHIFWEVVLTNPASAGKNFWDYLAHVFPSRSSKELVSYYFNVFVLRKRAEQNRFDPLNIDSDNDEWQEIDDVQYALEDEEDSAVESLVDQKDTNCKKDSNEEVDVDNETEHESGQYAVFETNGGRLSATSVGAEDNAQNSLDDHEVQDDSCTSFEAQVNGVDNSGGSLCDVGNQHGINEGHKNLPKNDSLIAIDHGFLEGHCGPKAWDIDYKHGAQKDDFLSTCNVMEDGLGKEVWE